MVLKRRADIFCNRALYKLLACIRLDHVMTEDALAIGDVYVERSGRGGRKWIGS